MHLCVARLCLESVRWRRLLLSNGALILIAFEKCRYIQSVNPPELVRVKQMEKLAEGSKKPVVSFVGNREV